MDWNSYFIIVILKFFFFTETAYIEENECFFEKDGMEGNITRDDISKDLIAKAQMHSLKLDCLWKIEVEPDQQVRFLFNFSRIRFKTYNSFCFQIMLTFSEFGLQKKNDCDRNFLDVYGENTNISEP